MDGGDAAATGPRKSAVQMLQEQLKKDFICYSLSAMFLRKGVISGGYKTTTVPMVYAPVGESLEGESACSVANSGAMAPRLRNAADWRRRFKA